MAINDNPTVQTTQASTSKPKTHRTSSKPSIPSTPSILSTPSISSTPSSSNDDGDFTSSTPHEHNKSTTPEVLPEFQFFEDNKYPFLVFIHVKLPNGLSSNCVGTLIEPLIVLTSAHCTFKISPKHIMVTNTFSHRYDKLNKHTSYLILFIIFMLFCKL